MNKLLTRFRNLRAGFGRLSQQEQFIVLVSGGVATFVILVGLGWAVASAIDSAEHRVKVKTEQLSEVLRLQGEYRAKIAEKEARLLELDKSAKVRMVSMVEDIARQAGVEIGQLRPEDSEPTPDGIIESRLDLKVSNLSADRLQDFLDRLEKAPGLVVVRRLKLNRPYRRDTLDLEVTLTTYKRKES